MTSIDILFFLIQYSVYIFFGYKIYLKFIRPHLIAEQQEYVAQETQLHQRHVLAQEALSNMQHRIEFLTVLFNKIKEQNNKAQQTVLIQRHQQEIKRAELIQELKEYQEKTEHIRFIEHNYTLLVPEITKQLTLQLEEYFQEHNQEHTKRYLEKAILTLHHAAEEK